MRRQSACPALRGLAVCLLLSAWCGSAGAEGTAGGAAPYLREGMGARGLGMGNAQTAAAAEAAAAYWNPAALTALNGSGLASQLALLGDGRAWNALSFCQSGMTARLGHYAYGLSWFNFTAGSDLEARASNRPEPEGIFGDAQNAFVLALASDFGSGVAVGTNLKILSHKLSDETAMGTGIDLALWQRLDEVAWGLVLQDLYSALSWSGRHTDRLPTLTRAGLAWYVIPDTLKLAVDGTLEWSHAGQTVSELGYHLGAEYWVFEFLALRGGVDRGHFSAGVGFDIPLGSVAMAHLDYAWASEQLPGAGARHLFSLNVDFPSAVSAEQE